MSKPMTAAETRAAMKKWGVPYKEYPGWTTRTRPGGFAPVGIIIHHTGSDAGQSDDYLNFLFVRGRPEDGIPGPLCNVATDMDGDLHLGAIGRANHAGSGSSTVLNHVKAEDYNGYTVELRPGADDVNGNGYYYGNELRYDGGQPPTAKMYATAVRWAAAVCDFHGWTALSVISHREHTRRKRDPGNCPMNKFRTDLAAVLKAGPNPNPVAGEPMSTDTTYAHVHAKACALKLEEAMVSLGMTPPSRPAVTGEGDDYYAHYWAKYSHYLADLVAAKVAPAPKA
jgi:hypothetical protein